MEPYGQIDRVAIETNTVHIESANAPFIFSGQSYQKQGEKVMWDIIAWIVLGLIAGAIAKAIYPGTQGGGIVATIILGIVGAVVGGWVGRMLIGTTAGASTGALTLPSIALAVLGAMIVLFLWGLFTRRAA
jgi:uncharacterized membrane protein YeaQ/YmgE (transglycosylase-associated protein family)